MKKIFKFGRSFPSDTLRAEISSGDGDESPECKLTLALYGWRLEVRLPHIIQPYCVRHAAQWDAATVARMGRNWYDEKFERRYGFYVFENSHLYVSLGAQTHDSTTTKSWSCFLPWTQWRFIRHTYYDLGANVFWQQMGDSKKASFSKYEDQYAAEQECPKANFKLLDYDGAEIVASTVIEEREWLRGDKCFKWLSWFFKPMVRRSLKIDFSAETGPEKGSWKGGTTGTSIEMQPGELHESAMRRYCDKEHNSKYSKYRMQFIQQINEMEP